MTVPSALPMVASVQGEAAAHAQHVPISPGNPAAWSPLALHIIMACAVHSAHSATCLPADEVATKLPTLSLAPQGFMEAPQGFMEAPAGSAGASLEAAKLPTLSLGPQGFMEAPASSAGVSLEAVTSLLPRSVQGAMMQCMASGDDSKKGGGFERKAPEDSPPDQVSLRVTGCGQWKLVACLDHAWDRGQLPYRVQLRDKSDRCQVPWAGGCSLNALGQIGTGDRC